MTNPLQILPPLSSIVPKGAAAAQLRLQQTMQLVKSNRSAQIITIALGLIIISTIGSAVIAARSKKQVTFQQPQFFHPSPSPQNTTRFANHPVILGIEQELPDVETSISNQIIQKHPLAPPSLDMKVTLDK